LKKEDAAEAEPILQRTMTALLGTVPTQGRAGAAARLAVGDLTANAEVLLRSDQAGTPMADCYNKVRLAGTTWVNFAGVRAVTTAEPASTLGGVLTRHSLIQLNLAAEARVIADMAFRSRQEVLALRDELNAAFSAIEEAATDVMDSTTYLALVRLHAAVMAHLIETARPLPRLVRFQFAQPLTTLLASHRLYDTAARADELRAENKVVHPAFMLPAGRALSA